MSDEIAKQFEDQKNLQASDQAGRAAILTITLHPNRQLEMSFPNNELLAYGMLEKARAKLDELALIREFQRTQSARGGMEGLLKKITGGK